jgi:uncharacterized damage-inducible protein DinB
MVKTIETKKTFTLGSLIREYAVYNAWAAKRLVDWLKTKPVDLIEWEVASSFPSIRHTLVHIWDTQRFWLAVFQQTDMPQSYRKGYDGTTAELLEGFFAQSEEMSRYVLSLSEEQIIEACELKTPWVSGILPRYEFIQHCINHSTYHRGQVVTIGRQLGFTDAPMTDYNYYKMIG